MAVNKGFGERVRKIRKDLKLSQEEFGNKFTPPASKGIVSRWEHGGTPNNTRLKKIASLGNVSVDYLLTGQDLLVNGLDSLLKINLADSISDKSLAKMVKDLDKLSKLIIIRYANLIDSDRLTNDTAEVFRQFISNYHEMLGYWVALSGNQRGQLTDNIKKINALTDSYLKAIAILAASEASNNKSSKNN